MGSYSDSDDDYHKRKKRKKRRSRSRSRSYEGTPDSYSSRKSSSKHKKKKSKHKRKSYSRSPDSRKRSRSRSYERRRSRSGSRGRYRRSRSRDRRSRSRDRRSRSRDRRRRSKSSSRSPRRSYRRSRSSSRARSRRISPYSRRSRSRSSSPIRKKTDQQIKIKEEPDDPCLQIPGFQSMTPAEQTQARLQLALKAAAAADEKLKEQGLLPSGVKSENSLPTLEEQQRRQKALEEIESTDFVPSEFVSSRTQKANKDGGEFSHEKAMFGGDLPAVKTESKGTVFTEDDTLMHPSLYANQEERWELWRQKLIAYRKRKLEGEVMA